MSTTTIHRRPENLIADNDNYHPRAAEVALELLLLGLPPTWASRSSGAELHHVRQLTRRLKS